MATVQAIHVAPQKGAPLESVEAVEAVAGEGLQGDRYLGVGGKRQLTIVSTEELDEAAEEWGQPIPPGATRRNVTISGMRLPRKAGAKLRLGAVIVEVDQDCAPCGLMENCVGEGAKQALVERAGVRARLPQGGAIRVGDPVVRAG